MTETGSREGTLSTGVGRDLCPSRTTLATSRKLSLEEQEQKQDQLQALQETGQAWGVGEGAVVCALGQGRSSGKRNTVGLWLYFKSKQDCGGSECRVLKGKSPEGLCLLPYPRGDYV